MFARGGWIIAIGVLLGWWTAAAVAQAPQAQPRAVIWLDHAAPDVQVDDGAARAERERALRLELQARNYLLLESRPSDRSAPPDRTAATLLARTTAVAVLWLEPDKERPVSWLMVRVRQRDDAAKSPLPHPPDAVEPQLIAIAAASLLDQALRESQLKSAVVPSPEQTAARAPRPPLPVATVIARPRIAPLPEKPRRDHFVQLGLALPFAYVAPGMEASSTPSGSEVLEMVGTRTLFDDTSAYVADADSYDDYEELDFQGNVVIPRGSVPASTVCAADGIETRTPELPSKYCVRVHEPGFELVPALRLAVGTWLAPEAAISGFLQWHFVVEAEEPFGSLAIGVQGEYLVAGQRDRGLALAMLAALSAGRTETPVAAAKDAGGSTVNALAGLFLAKTGASLRHAISSFGAVVASAAIGGRFPESQLELELNVGIEHGF